MMDTPLHYCNEGRYSTGSSRAVSHHPNTETACEICDNLQRDYCFYSHLTIVDKISSRTFLTLQWQQTVHRYLRVLHSRMMKRPPKNVTMEEARNAHHMRCPLLSQGTSEEKGMTTSSILDIKIEDSGFILLLILLVLIELSLPWGTVPSASASI